MPKNRRERRQNVEDSRYGVNQSLYGSGDVKNFSPKNPKQHKMWLAMQDRIVTIAHGCAGTGKTLLALWYGMLEVQDRAHDKVVYVRSDIGSDYQRGRGAVKGSLDEKMIPLIGPLFDNVPVFMKSAGAAEYVLRTKKIEPLLLEDIRGRSLNRSFIVVDECQNFTPEQIKTVLTRVGAESKIVLVGDTRQADLEVFRKGNGLTDAVKRLSDLPEVGIVQFYPEEIVRNSVIANIIRAYDH